MLLAVVHHTSQFWPTVERVLTGGATLLGGVASWWGRKNHNLNVEIRTLVNGKFSDKVDELADTAQKLREVTEQRDQAQAATTAAIAAGDTPKPETTP
jgi:hypothetical protein